MIYNDVDLRENFKIISIKKDVLPPVENITKLIPGRPGVKLSRSNMGPRRISADIEVKGSNKSELQSNVRILASILYTGELKQLRLPGELDKYYMAKLNGSTEVKEILYYGNTTLNFLCPDPLAYGESKAINITGNPTLINSGTYKTTGIITIEITEPVSGIDITLQNTGEFISIGHNFALGDMVIIDLEEEMIYKNGESIMYDCALESDFFSIPTGEFQVSVSSGNATLEFTERWL